MLLLLLMCHDCLGAKIMMWMSVGSKSHFIVWKPLAMELAKRGHDLTIVAPVPDKGIVG